jgi:hypothetical protein
MKEAKRPKPGKKRIKRPTTADEADRAVERTLAEAVLRDRERRHDNRMMRGQDDEIHAH